MFSTGSCATGGDNSVVSVHVRRDKEAPPEPACAPPGRT